MSTPEERLHQKAEALRVEREMREKEQQEEEARQRADLQQRARAAAAEAQAWLVRAEELVNATRTRVPVWLNYDLDEGPGFELTVGTAVFRALLQPDGWRVVRTSPSGLYCAQALPTDLLVVRDTVLERMVEQGLDDVIGGRVPPAPEWGR